MKKALQHPFFKNFILKLLSFLVVLFVLDRAIGMVLERYYFKQQGGYDFLTTEAIDKTKAELIVFGSSRAVNIFNTEILEDRSGFSSYNAGRYGGPIFYHYAILKAILKRHHPNLIILSFDAGNFSKSEVSYDRLSPLLPYYKNHPELREIIKLRGPYEKIKLLSACYPYNSLILPILTGNRASSSVKYANVKGFIPLTRTISGPLSKFDYTLEQDLDTLKINTYVSFIKDCQAAKIPLYIVCPPYMINSTGVDKSILKGREIAGVNGVKFLDFTTDTFYTNNRSLFADYRHLNETGVKFFVNDVMNKIKSGSN